MTKLSLRKEWMGKLSKKRKRIAILGFFWDLFILPFSIKAVQWSLLFVNLNVTLGKHILFPLILAMFDSMVQTLRKTCLRLPLTQRSLSLDASLRAKEGGKEKTSKTSLLLSSFTFPWSHALRHQSLAFRPRFCTKNEAPKEEAVSATWFRKLPTYPIPVILFFTLYSRTAWSKYRQGESWTTWPSWITWTTWIAWTIRPQRHTVKYSILKIK